MRLAIRSQAALSDGSTATAMSFAVGRGLSLFRFVFFFLGASLCAAIVLPPRGNDTSRGVSLAINGGPLAIPGELATLDAGLPMSDESRKAILARRAYFVAAAVASTAIST